MRSWLSHRQLTPGLLAGVYAVLGGAWLLASGALTGGGESPLRAETALHIAFIAATASLLYLLLKQSSLQLVESQRVLSTLMSNLPGMAYRCLNDPNWTMLFVSDGCEGITGYAPRQLLHNAELAYEDLILPPDRERVRNEVEAAVREDRPFELVYRMRTANGEEKWVWERGTAVRTEVEGVVLEGFIADITERRRAEQVNALLATAVEHAGEGMMVTDRNGTILYANPAFEEMTGYSREEVVGLNPRILKSEEHDPGFYREMWNAIKQGDVWCSRIINRKRDGSLYEERQTISPVRDAYGAIVNYVAIKRDVTELTSLETQLRHSQKMEAVGKLAGGISHDFNNLLMAIMGHCELLSAQLEEKSREWADVEEIKKSCQRAALLTRQLLAFSRRQMLKPRVLDLNVIVSDMQGMLARLIGTDIELVTRLDPELHLVKADGGQLEQVIMNLAVNARDAMSSGGTLTIETQNVEAGELAGHGEIGPGPCVMLSVSDTGTGIRLAIQDRVFEPYFSTKEFGKGTGLGLSTVHGIVTESGGELALESQPGRGTTFRVSLPAAILDEEAVAQGRLEAQRARSTEARTAETILVVGAAGPSRDNTVEILERAGYVVLSASDVKEAVSICDEFPGSVALLVSEIDHGEMLANRPAVRALRITGAEGVSPEARRGARLLEKPFAPEMLLTAVRELLAAPMEFQPGQPTASRRA